MNIHFRACPRCGGDIDATFGEDARCIQCGHRVYEAAAGLVRQAHHERVEGGFVPRWDPHPRIKHGAGSNLPPAPRGEEQEIGEGGAPCPRCRSVDLAALDRLSPGHNLCFRCRLCGHIFSPAAA